MDRKSYTLLLLFINEDSHTMRLVAYLRDCVMKVAQEGYICILCVKLLFFISSCGVLFSFNPDSNERKRAAIK